LSAGNLDFLKPVSENKELAESIKVRDGGENGSGLSWQRKHSFSTEGLSEAT